MDTAMIVLYQAVVMFIMIVVGFLCYKIRMISKETNLQLSNLLLMVINPCIIFVSFQTDFDIKLVVGLLWAMGLSVVSVILMQLISRLLLQKKPELEYKVERFGCIYTNCGFFGTPLVYAMFGAEGVLYLTAFIAASNLFMWTHGVGIFTGKMNLKQLINCLKAPTIIAILLGLLCFFCRIRIPDFLYDPLNFIGSMNSAVGMLVAGNFIAQTNILKAFTKLRLYWVGVVHLLIIPLVLIPILAALPAGDTVLITVLIAAATPPAVSIMMFAARFHANELYAAEVFSVCTLLGIITIPICTFLFTALRQVFIPLLPYLS